MTIEELTEQNKFLTIKLSQMAIRLTTTDIFKEHLCKYVKEIDSSKLEAIQKEVLEIASIAKLEFQKKLGTIYREFGVDNLL